MKHSFAIPKLKVQRGLILLSELEAAIQAFSDTKPAQIIPNDELPDDLRERVVTLVKDHPHSLEFSYRFSPVPPMIGAIVGDVVHNLRSALDHGVCQLARIVSGNHKNVRFPFSDNAEGLELALKKSNVGKAGPKAIILIRDLKPYKGGNDTLRGLHDLDIRDKHYAITPALMQVPGPIVQRWDDKGVAGLQIVGDPNNLPITMVFPDDCAFAQQEIVSTLNKLVSLIDGIVSQFAALANE